MQCAYVVLHWYLLYNTDTRRLMTGIRSEKCVVKLFRRTAYSFNLKIVKISECLYRRSGRRYRLRLRLGCSENHSSIFPHSLDLHMAECIHISVV
jgi:hypothetical protein